MLDLFLQSHSFRPVLDSPSKRIQLSGLNNSSLAIVTALLNQKRHQDVLVITDKLDTAEKFRDDIDVLLKDKLSFFPNDELLPFDNREANPAIISLRIETLLQLTKSNRSVVICEARSLMKKLLEPDAFRKQKLRIELGDEIDFTDLIETLDLHGFKREETVEKVGTFSIRGGIVDLFPWTQDDPIRIEFYGDQIESIRNFDLVSQRSIKQIDSVEIYSNIFASQGKSSLFDYLENPLVIRYEPELIDERLGLFEQEANDHITSHKLDKSLYQENYFSRDEINRFIEQFDQLVYQSKRIDGFDAIKLKTSHSHFFDGKIKNFISYLNENRLKNIRSIILCDNNGLKDRLTEILDEYEIPLPEIQVGALHDGLFLADDAIDIINEHEIFNRFKRRKAYKKFKRAEAIRALNTLSYGDYVVHVDFGIGRFVGLQILQLNDAEKECLKLEYDGKDYVYIGIDRIQRIQKYVSEDGVIPKLTKLGGKEWDRLKSRTKKQVETIAKELIELYAERSMSNGFAFSPDGNWQHELEASFEFEDTADQAKATTDFKA
ncbi:MAG: hypothetical protein KDD94_04865, partial [Calditrichaeota bacterium]|nr:hypothetical protein [Calditrichota bacterium]